MLGKAAPNPRNRVCESTTAATGRTKNRVLRAIVDSLQWSLFEVNLRTAVLNSTADQTQRDRCVGLAHHTLRTAVNKLCDGLNQFSQQKEVAKEICVFFSL